MIDAAIKGEAKRFVFASSSSVYGGRGGEQFLETDRVDRPLSPYAATKVAGEQLCYVAHHTTGLPVICLRFFQFFRTKTKTGSCFA